MSKENDRIPERIACIATRRTPATLISTKGHHCEVWRTTRVITCNSNKYPADIVIKRHRKPCPLPEVRVLQKEYQEMRLKLGDIIPKALFVSTKVDHADNVIVIAEAVNPWFNIANPANEDNTIPMLRQLPRARKQLRKFVEAAKSWHQEQDLKIVDLYGLDNLVLDVNREIKYIDSFCVFFYGDLLYILDDVHDELQEKIDLSLQRRNYLEYVLKESRIARMPPISF